MSKAAETVSNVINPGDLTTDLDLDADLEGAERGDEVESPKKPVKKAPPKKAKEPEEGEEEEESEEEDESEDEDEEDEEEDEAEEEEEDEGEGEPAKGATDSDQRVPLSRLKAVIAQRNRLEAELAKQAKDVKVDATVRRDILKELNESLDGLYEKVEALRADNDSKGAAKVQREIDETNRKISRIESAHDSGRIAMEATQNAMYNAMISQLEEMVPELKSGSKTFDPSLVSEVQEVTDAFIASGSTPPDALRRATTYVFQKDYFDGRATAESLVRRAKDAKPLKKETDKKKNADAVERTPATVERGVSTKKDKINIATLSEEEFDKLPESVKAKYRGDFVE